MLAIGSKKSKPFAKICSASGPDASRKHRAQANGWCFTFIPRTTTLGCTHEAMDFTAALQALRELGAKVLGVSRDPPASHKKFAEKHGMGLKLASEDVRQRELRPGFGLPFSSTREERSYKLNTP